MRPRHEQPVMTILRRAFEAGAELDFRRAAELCGLNVRNARPYLLLLHQELREIHIHRWGFTGKGPRFPIYAWGEGDDAEPPELATEKARRRRARNLMSKGGIRAALPLLRRASNADHR